jgi:hypothetical protein
MFLTRSLVLTKGSASMFRQSVRTKYLPRNLLKLNERSRFIQDSFPPESTQRLAQFLEDQPRSIYAGDKILCFVGQITFTKLNHTEI